MYPRKKADKKVDKKVDKKERRHEDGQLGKQYPQSGSVYTGRTAKRKKYYKTKICLKNF